MKVRIEIDTKTFVRFWLVVIGFGLAGLMIYSARDALMVLGTALFLALALNAPVRKLASWLPGKSRLGGTALAFMLLIIILTSVIWFVVPPLVQQSAKFAETLPGLVNGVLDLVGLDGLGRAWLSDIRTVLAAVSIPEGWRFLGLYTIILYAALLSVPRELEEAAALDGANAWQIFTRIRFPHIRPVWATTMVMAVTYGLRGFDIPYLLTNGGPGQSSELVTTYMYKTAFVSTNYGYASAISVFIVIECLIAVALIFALLRRGND